MTLGAYVGAGLFATFFAIRSLPFLRARFMRGKPAPDLGGILSGNHEQAMIYFFSDACGMCKSMTPVIERLAAENSSVLKLDVVQHLELARRFGVMGTPTTILVRNDKVEKIWLGVRSEAQLRRALQES